MKTAWLTARRPARCASTARPSALDGLVKVMKAGAGGSAMLDLKARPMRRHDYSTLFKLAHMLKDVRLCLAGTTLQPP